MHFLRRQFLQDGDLPFTDVLTEGVIAQALATLTGWLDRIFSPLVTLWVFLGQVRSADHSCRSAVARLRAHRLSQGQRPCSAQTGAYCQTRRRLAETFFADVACAVGRKLDARAERDWLWQGRRVYRFDGTTVTLPDTAKNQAAYPQVDNQKPGLGFPIARLGALISLACGAVVNRGFCRYAGKGQAAGPGAGDQGGLGDALPRALAQRTRYTIPEVLYADGGATVQDAGAGAPGGMDAPPGLQPPPHRDGPGRGRSVSRGRCKPWQRSSRCWSSVPRRDAASRLRLYHDLLAAVATHRVGDRPDRYEPRLKKRRRHNYDWLTRDFLKLQHPARTLFAADRQRCCS
jgi:hypothetical protein